jgi:hypothetical protein
VGHVEQVYLTLYDLGQALPVDYLEASPGSSMFIITSEGFHLASECFSSAILISESPKIISLMSPKMLLTLCQCKEP